MVRIQEIGDSMASTNVRGEVYAETKKTLGTLLRGRYGCLVS